MALPPEHELAAVENVYQAPDAVKRIGPARVLVGTHGGVASPLKAPASMTYLAVRLKAGESWSYQPPVGQTVGWIALGTGRVLTPDSVEAGELAIFEPSNGPIDVHAEADTEFVLGSSVPHPYDLVLGSHSVHTSAAALRAAEQRISEIQRRLQSEGRL
jgi:redox-sensitive bicupin YhaK (pirin superfamily)